MCLLLFLKERSKDGPYPTWITGRSYTGSNWTAQPWLGRQPPSESFLLKVNDIISAPLFSHLFSWKDWTIVLAKSLRQRLKMPRPIQPHLLYWTNVKRKISHIVHKFITQNDQGINIPLYSSEISRLWVVFIL